MVSSLLDGRRDVTCEAESVRLASPRPQPAGERQGLAGVAPGLVDPPGRKNRSTTPFCSEEAGYISGATLDANGGLHIG
jgi:hypothetical protein